MIKKLLKNISNGYLNRNIKRSIANLNDNRKDFKLPILKVGCIIDTNLDVDYFQILELMEKIGLKQKDVKIISYSDTAFNDPFSKMRISKDSINFYGKIVSADANEFISYDYDLLINYFGDNEILTLISSKTNSNFRVGYSESNKNINDIMFSNFFNNFEKFSNELIKYLKFLK
jgi:carboxypeptidase C (cathepsin A)